jgi:hypothetical protein
MYQLIRQRGAISQRTFEITFVAPGARVFVFTFGLGRRQGGGAGCGGPSPGD